MGAGNSSLLTLLLLPGPGDESSSLLALLLLSFCSSLQYARPMRQGSYYAVYTSLLVVVKIIAIMPLFFQS